MAGTSPAKGLLYGGVKEPASGAPFDPPSAGAFLDKSRRSMRCRRAFAPSAGSVLMHAYRTHTCGALRLDNAGAAARLAGWVHRKRDHGQLLFVDLRDHYGITQCVIDVSSPLFSQIDGLRLESVVSFTGKIVRRSPETVNPNLPTGEVELVIEAYELLAAAEPLPFPVNSDAEYPEAMRRAHPLLY